jgi:hypothetical protein
VTWDKLLINYLFCRNGVLSKPLHSDEMEMEKELCDKLNSEETSDSRSGEKFLLRY